MALCDPHGEVAALASLALVVAFASASQDIVYDAYRTDIAKPEQRGLAAAMTVVGYRTAMLTSGALALVLVAGTGWFRALSWQETYFLMAALMALCTLATLWGPEPQVAAPPPRTLEEAVRAPLREFFSRPGVWALLLLIVLYKLGDAFAGALTTAFLLRGMGFGLADVAYVNKVMALIASIVGAVAGGTLMVWLGLYRSLMLFGIVQAVSLLAFMALALVGKSYPVMVLAVGVENFSAGMGTAAFVALLMALCDHRFTATQYALLSAIAAIGRVYVGPAAGYATDPRYLGLSWASFFFVTFLLALPGLALLYLKRATIEALDRSP
jgi:PAT family beta-lactamase induction signal transducer AmpG